MALPKVKPAKQTYYMSRGKVHLTKDEQAVWCGVALENISHATTEIISVTCQRCLMHMTKNWKPRAKK